MYNMSAEEAAKKAGLNVFQYEKRCKEYVECLSERARAMRSGDIELFDYVFSFDFDKEKHIAHEKAIEAVRELNAECRRLGLDVIYDGDEKNSKEIGRFVCHFSGEKQLADFAD